MSGLGPVVRGRRLPHIRLRSGRTEAARGGSTMVHSTTLRRKPIETPHNAPNRWKGHQCGLCTRSCRELWRTCSLPRDAAFAVAEAPDAQKAQSILRNSPELLVVLLKVTLQQMDPRTGRWDCCSPYRADTPSQNPGSGTKTVTGSESARTSRRSYGRKFAQRKKASYLASKPTFGHTVWQDVLRQQHRLEGGER